MTDISLDIVARRQANRDLVPIGRLPDELLLVIFRHTKTSYYEWERFRDRDDYDEQDAGGEDAGYEWIKALHTCYRWYAVGVGAATLWTTVSEHGGLECMQTVLKRSQGLLLNVNITFPGINTGWTYSDEDLRRIASHKEVAYAIMAQMPRIRSLVVGAFHDEDFWKRLQITEPPRNLEILKLHLWDEQLEDASDRVFNFASDWVFAFDLSSLRELKLKLDRPSCGVIRAPALRILHAHAQDEDEGTYDPRDLLESMRQMPRLEDVSIYYPSPHALDMSKHFNMNKVSLPNLKAFSFAERVPAYESFLDRLTFPANALSRLSTSLDIWMPSDIDATITILREKLLKIHRPDLETHRPIHKLQVTCSLRNTADRSLQFVGCPHLDECCCGSYHELDHRDESCLRLNICYVPGMHGWDRLDGFAEILDLLPLNDVKELHIGSRDVYNSFKAHLDLLDVSQVPHCPVSMEELELHRFTLPAPSEDVPCELASHIRRLMPNLTTLYVIFNPWFHALEREMPQRADVDAVEW